jgi:opacity protein-like surface antigen
MLFTIFITGCLFLTLLTQVLPDRVRTGKPGKEKVNSFNNLTMRNILLAFFLLSTCSLVAQYEKGNWYLEGNSGIGDVSPQQGNADGVVRFGGGLFVTNRFLVGVRFSDDTHLTTYGRYYFPLRGKRLSYFAEVGATYSPEGAAEPFGFHGAVGLEYEFAPGLMLNTALGYRVGGRQNQASLDINMNVILGERYRPEGGYDFLNRKGTLLLNGDVANLSLTNFRDDQLSVFGNARLSVGYFLGERLYVEAGLAFGASDFKLGSEAFPQDISVSSRTAEVSARYFLLPGKRFQPYVGAGIAYDYINREWAINGQQTFHRTNNLANLQTGFLHHLNERVALDFNLRYNGAIGSSDPDFFSGGLGLKVRLAKQ